MNIIETRVDMDVIFATYFVLLCIHAIDTGSETYGDGTVHAAFVACCDDTNLAVYFNKTALDERTSTSDNRAYTISFKDQLSTPECVVKAINVSNIDADVKDSLPRPIEYPSTIFITATYDACGIQAISDTDFIIYKHTIVVTYGSNPDPNVIREEKDLYDVMCLRNRTAHIIIEAQGFNNTKYRQDGHSSQNATSNFGLALKHSDANGLKQPVYKLGQFIMFKLDSSVLQSGDRAVVQKCWLSNGIGDAYILIDRCNVEPGTSFVTYTENVTEWKTEAFRFPAQTRAIHVECIVRICLRNDPSPLCSLCPVGGSNRRRRSVEGSPEHTEIALVKSGSFMVIEQGNTQDNTVSNSNEEQSYSILTGTNGIVMVALLAAFLSLISVVIIKKVFCASQPIAGSLDSEEESANRI